MTVAGVYKKYIYIYIYKAVDSLATFVALKLLCHGILKLMGSQVTTEISGWGGERIVYDSIGGVVSVQKDTTLMKRGS